MNSSSKFDVTLDQVMPLFRECLAAGQSVTFSPKGTSMLPMLHQGRDTVELSPLPEKLKKYDLPLYQRDNGQYVLHRIVKVGEAYTCIGDNQFQLEYPVRHDQMIGLVTAFTRDGKKISVTNFRYKAYCRYWHWTRKIRRLIWLSRHGIMNRMKRLFS